MQADFLIGIIALDQALDLTSWCALRRFHEIWIPHTRHAFSLLSANCQCCLGYPCISRTPEPAHWFHKCLIRQCRRAFCAYLTHFLAQSPLFQQSGYRERHQLWFCNTLGAFVIGSRLAPQPKICQTQTFFFFCSLQNSHCASQAGHLGWRRSPRFFWPFFAAKSWLEAPNPYFRLLLASCRDAWIPHPTGSCSGFLQPVGPHEQEP